MNLRPLLAGSPMILLLAGCAGDAAGDGDGGSGEATGTAGSGDTGNDPSSDDQPSGEPADSGDVSGNDPSSTDSDSDSDTDTDPTGEPVCEGTEFAGDASAWTLPDLGLPLGGPQLLTQLSDYWGCTNDQTLRYSSLDITGDGVLDLVVTDACDAAGAGTSAWLVHRGGNDGFGDDPESWTLPDLGLPLGGPQNLVQLGDYWGCTNDQTLRYSTIDITGDGMLDLVVTDACDAEGAGTTAWVVYRGGDGGFADEPDAWTLPDLSLPLGGPQNLVQLGDYWGCTNDQTLRYSTIDITGDGMLDLVVTDACDAEGAGTTAWLVYRGGDGGFADEPDAWSLPDLGLPLGGPQHLVQLGDYWGCTNDQTLRYSTIDITGDGMLDLVVTDACDVEGAGTTAWLVYRGGDGGFADEPEAWSLPDLGLPLGGPQHLVQLGDYWGCTNDQTLRYSTIDITGDGMLDLVVTDACDVEGAGTSAWLVYAGGDGGFASDPSAWSLPDLGLPLGGPQNLVQLADYWGCTNDQTLRYTTVDLDGEGHLDLVVTDACDADGAGTSAWLLFPGTCG